MDKFEQPSVGDDAFVINGDLPKWTRVHVEEDCRCLCTILFEADNVKISIHDSTKRLCYPRSFLMKINPDDEEQKKILELYKSEENFEEMMERTFQQFFR